MPGSAQQRWAKEGRKKAVALCGEPIPPPPAIAWQLVRLLALEPEADDVEPLQHCIMEWSPQLYGHASPVAWATTLYRRHRLPVRAMLEPLLETGPAGGRRRGQEILQPV